MSSDKPSDPSTIKRRSYQLVAFAAAILYFELAIIRFTSAQVLYLGYFSNFILISAFVGLGLGFLAARRDIELRGILPFVLLFLFALVLTTEFDVDVLRNRGGLFFFGNRTADSGLPGVVLLPLLFVSSVALFAALAQQTGRLFSHFSPLRAYTLDICGSLLGIGLFSLQSLAWAGPITWVLSGTLLVVLAYLLQFDRPSLHQAAFITVAALAVVVLLLASRSGNQVVWSTYQKLEVKPHETEPERMKFIYANGIIHQYVRAAADAKKMFYQIPFEVQSRASKRLDRVLIVGAGCGTDTAVALAAGAKKIDAVEIDAGIVELGLQHHPDHPYQDRRVDVHVTDGRQFLRSSRERYDMIIFALPDSLVLLSSMSSLRLESYLFTLESFAEARARLKPHGILVLYNQYRWDWLKRKIALMLKDSFGHAPVELSWNTTTVFAVGQQLRGKPVAQASAAPLELATDDWPFLYMQRPGISWPYLGMIGMFLICALLGVGLLAPRGTLTRPDWPFFFMGAAFLLLETKSISFFSLLFGSTWMVNALAFGGILLSVLLANLIIARITIKRRWLLFGALFGALALAYAIPPTALLGIASPVTRYAAGILFIFSPVFVANLVFSREFSGVEASARAFGWNMLGAVAGGGLEYVSLLVGHRNLLWLVALFYLLTALLLERGGIKRSTQG